MNGTGANKEGKGLLGRLEWRTGAIPKGENEGERAMVEETCVRFTPKGGGHPTASVKWFGGSGSYVIPASIAESAEWRLRSKTGRGEFGEGTLAVSVRLRNGKEWIPLYEYEEGNIPEGWANLAEYV